MVGLGRKRLFLVSLLSVVAALLLTTVPARRAQAYTSPIDVTGTKLQVHTVVPDRDTGQPVEQNLPLDLLGPAFATPLSTQMDQFWNGAPYLIDANGKMQTCNAATTPAPPPGADPNSKCETPQQHACDTVKGEMQTDVGKKVGSGYSPYGVSCTFAQTGQLLADQVDSTVYLSYLLRANMVQFSMTTPYTCNPNDTSYGCLNDPVFTVTFAVELSTVVRVPDICEISAEPGTVTSDSASIDSHNASSDIAQHVIDALILGHKFSDAERAIDAITAPIPLPLDSTFTQLRDACKSPTSPVAQTLAAYSNSTSVDVEAPGIIFRLTHPAIGAPVASYDDGAAAIDPQSLFHPTLSASLPFVTAGQTVQLSGQYFPAGASGGEINFQQPESTRLNVGLCQGGGTDVEWGPAGTLQRQTIAADSAGYCPSGFTPPNLTAGAGYQARARNCDALTCSAWSATINFTYTPSVPSTVTLSMDGGVQANVAAIAPHQLGSINLSPVQLFSLGAGLGTVTLTPAGTFSTTVTIPAGTSAGAHTIHAGAGNASADLSLQVNGAATSAGNASIVVVNRLSGETGCPPRPTTTIGSDIAFQVYGSGFTAGTVTISLDSATGTSLGTATAGADGSFCATLQPIPHSQAGAHSLVATEGGQVVAQLNVTVAPPPVIN